MYFDVREDRPEDFFFWNPKKNYFGLFLAILKIFSSKDNKVGKIHSKLDAIVQSWEIQGKVGKMAKLESVMFESSFPILYT